MVFNFFKSSFRKVQSALAKTRSYFSVRLRSLFQKPINAETLEELEELFYQADLGVKTSLELVEKISAQTNHDPDYLIDFVKDELRAILDNIPKPVIPSTPPKVVLIVGVNGNGKTTSIAKLAKLYKSQGKSVLLAAADTFRAAAIDQLAIWSERLGIPLVKGAPKSDAAAVCFDAATAAVARGVDVLLIDTAGRLHTKTDLMNELSKIARVLKKVLPDAPHETMLVIDATTGQNGIDQARTFHEFTPLTGLILTKLDGTAKGGITIAIQRELQIPVAFIGTGESEDDLLPFDADQFTTALFS